ncbi:MAG TPA: iron-sulfur cluster repair di-iron protein [Acidisarcina sp.]|nr:iron-sulfur cluster repair di-iron protein [Acidisarcina sp.]
MNPLATTTVREIALEEPSSIRVFEHFGIDYCCGGRVPLANACAELQLPLEDVLKQLDESRGQQPADNPSRWQTAPLAELTEYIVRTHHERVNRETPRMIALANKVAAKHGPGNPNLLRIEELTYQIDEEMRSHQGKEEQVLFPYIQKLEAASTGGAAPRAGFGSISFPIQMMLREHDSAGAITAEFRSLSNGYQTPPGACPTYHALFDALREFEEDLHRHVHLENNILFPRAIELEASLQSAAS